jgi:uncharacterized protein YegL
MAGLTRGSSPRRLPVLFMLDTSKDMDGTFQVTLHDGLLTLKNELVQQTVSSPLVYLGLITFGEKVLYHRLRTPKFFEPPVWQGQGRTYLGPAFKQLTDLISNDLMTSRPDYSGDHPPLIFLVLGSQPIDDWQKSLQRLLTINDNRTPKIVTVVTRQDLLAEMQGISNKIFLLKPAKALSVTKFFFWATQTIIKVSEDYSRGSGTMIFPNPPLEMIPY